MSGSTIQSNVKLVEAQLRTSFSSPRPGLRIHFQAVPVTMNDSAIGYR